MSRQPLPACRFVPDPLRRRITPFVDRRQGWGVSESVLLLWDEELMRYDLGGTHPMHPGRLELTMALARDLSILARPSLSVAAPEPATDEILALVHDPAYIAVVRGSAAARIR